MIVNDPITVECNLCAFCGHDFAICVAPNVKFGTARGNDNVIECAKQWPLAVQREEYTKEDEQ